MSISEETAQELAKILKQHGMRAMVDGANIYFELHDQTFMRAIISSPNRSFIKRYNIKSRLNATESLGDTKCQM
jgi:hypothetical protein